ncbi:MAG: hypothetical protein ACR2IF_08490 [Terriglobales bacterium]
MEVSTHKRQLVFKMSERWSGWFCEACGWAVPLPSSRHERDGVAAKIDTDFQAHDCQRFTRPGPTMQS